MFGPIKQAARAFARATAYDPERAYLEEATSLVDLEMRQREIDNGRFRRRHVTHL